MFHGSSPHPASSGERNAGMWSSAVTAESTARTAARPRPASVVPMMCWQGGWRRDFASRCVAGMPAQASSPVSSVTLGTPKAFVGISIEGGGSVRRALGRGCQGIGHGGQFMSASSSVARAYNRTHGETSTGLDVETCTAPARDALERRVTGRPPNPVAADLLRECWDLPSAAGSVGLQADAVVSRVAGRLADWRRGSAGEPRLFGGKPTDGGCQHPGRIARRRTVKRETLRCAAESSHGMLSRSWHGYAERLFEYPDIGALDPAEARRALVKPAAQANVEFDDEAVAAVIRETQGYPYFLHEWGYQAWNTAGVSPISRDDIARSSETALGCLDRNFFRSRYERLSEPQKAYLYAMARCGPGPHRTGDIARALGKSSQQMGPTREALITSGMIYSPRYGYAVFTVPLFDAFMKRIYG